MLPIALGLLLAMAGCAGVPRPGAPDIAVLAAPARDARVVDARGVFRDLLCDAVRRAGTGDDCAALVWRFDDEPPTPAASPPASFPASGDTARALASSSSSTASDASSAPGMPAVLPARPAPPPRRLVFVPGLFGDCIARWATPFSDAYAALRARGHAVHVVSLPGRDPSAANAVRLRETLAALHAASPAPLTVVAYSKGLPDLLELLAAEPGVAGWIDAVVGVAGASGGSPLADRFDGPYRAFGGLTDLAGCPPGGAGDAVASLETPLRRARRAVFRPPAGVRFYSVGAIVRRDDAALPLQPLHDLLARLDSLNDGQLLAADAVLPFGTLLGYVRADHWSVALPMAALPGGRWIAGRDFPRTALIEAVIGVLDREAAAVPGPVR